jgi:hypothetical protein
MKKQYLNRNYNMQDADLYLQSMERLRYAHRDIGDFEQYGFGIERLKLLSHLIEQFRNLPDDEELLGDQMSATERKDKAAQELSTAIRGIMTRVAMKFHDKTGRYRKFGTSKLSDMSDPQLLFCGRRVVRVARQLIDLLDGTGLNDNQIQRVINGCTDLENTLNIQQDRLHDRDISVEIRIEKGNAIYQELVVLCDIGKDIWTNRDIKKYDQYCLYESNADYKKELEGRKSE